MSRLVIEESGARVNLVLWDDKVDEFGALEPGTRVRVISGNVRTGNQGGPEVHVGWDTHIQVVTRGVKLEEPVPHWTKIGDLKEDMGSVNVAALATQVGETREFIRRDGSEGHVVSVLLEDDTGTVLFHGRLQGDPGCYGPGAVDVVSAAVPWCPLLHGLLVRHCLLAEAREGVQLPQDAYGGALAVAPRCHEGGGHIGYTPFKLEAVLLGDVREVLAGLVIQEAQLREAPDLVAPLYDLILVLIDPLKSGFLQL